MSNITLTKVFKYNSASAFKDNYQKYNIPIEEDFLDISLEHVKKTY